MNSFKERLQEALNNSGLSQAELARRSGVGRNSISDYLKGKYEAKQDKLHALALALNVDEAWLMGYNIEPKRKDNTEHSSKENSAANVVAAHIDDDTPPEERQQIINFIENLKKARK